MEISGVNGTANLLRTTNNRFENQTSLHTKNNDLPAMINQRNNLINSDIEQNGGTNEENVKREEIDAAVKEMNHVFQAVNTHVKFTVHEDTNRFYVQVIDDVTNEVIREIPPKKFLDMVAAMEKYLGLFVDEKI